ncbi:MAG: hypothetical protein ACR2PM_11585 [Hyphomicrobiales bacterium]
MADLLRWFAFLTLVMAAVAVTPSKAENTLLKDVGQVPVSVHQVMTGGHWSADGAEGAYRAVVASVGSEHVKHQIYLQWLTLDAENGAYTVTRTTSVDEINADHGYVLDAHMEFTIEGQFRVHLRARARGAKADDNFIIVAKPAGGYTVTEVN